LLDDLKVALTEAMQMNRRDADESMASGFEEVVLQG
jgi:hypothetical protein